MFFSDTRVLRQQFNSKGPSVPYILIYKNRSNFLIASRSSLSGSTGVFPTLEVITETTETAIQQSVLQELRKQKTKLTIAQKKRENLFKQS